ncbi:WD40 repeat-like protein [Nadsonia fulvescens var. elongata DSM 6958]|uniref:DDB1- and CUL4-associated factor 13 n=1 Tax=Nadsonia fulvescens var. elongata DSM 6958 TaxID=857566 RepID=A0A1E3PHM5_9ASCO|nr:WD40 repeat-like protein [Nadsonia fulvescens var. elongata DSM 6958]
MKIKTISRSADAYVPVSSAEAQRLPRNLDPALHPFERAREYTKALNATKLERMFAKPFIGQLGGGHIDGVYSMAKNARALNRIATGSGDGIIKYWDMSTREEIFSVKAHENVVHGLAVTPEGKLLSCGSDKNVKLWDINLGRSVRDPVSTYLGDGAFMSIDHHRSENKFVTGGDVIELWDTNRSKPILNLSWGADNINNVKFNQTETSMVASTGSDRSIIIYDIRTSSPIQRMITTLRTNSICWNPMEAFNFAAASEDHNVYLYDMRKLNRALNVYKDHVAAVMDVDFSPTGEELVTGAYDRSIRIFKTREGHSRDIYHTKRMQKVMCVKYTMDSKYIVSGSEDGNVRLWRSNASEKANVKSSRERTKLEYDVALKERYKHMPEIKRIARHRHVPKNILKAGEIKRDQLGSIKNKEANVRRHSKKGSLAFQKEREKHIVSTSIKELTTKK